MNRCWLHFLFRGAISRQIKAAENRAIQMTKDNEDKGYSIYWQKVESLFLAQDKVGLKTAKINETQNISNITETINNNFINETSPEIGDNDNVLNNNSYSIDDSLNDGSNNVKNTEINGKVSDK